MLENGELKIVGGMTGDWEKDKGKFIRQQEDLEKVLGINVHTDDEAEDYD